MCIPMVNDAWEPINFLAEFRERETCLREVTELLKEKAQCEVTASLAALPSMSLSPFAPFTEIANDLKR